MSNNRTKVIVIICLSLCFSIMLCFLGFPRIVSLFKMMEVGSSGQGPIKSLILTIDKSQREELFDQLRKFAEKHRFEYELTDFNTNGENFQFWMSRDDIRIIAGNVPPDPSRVLLDFMLNIQDIPWMKKWLTN